MHGTLGLDFSNLSIRALSGILKDEDSPALGLFCVGVDEAGANDETLCTTGAIVLAATKC